MTETYSTYDAKAKLSEILRKVESGRTIRISRRGEPIAEIRPVPHAPTMLADRIDELADRGVLIPPAAARGALRPLAHRPGALERFLSDRDG
jgi:prevent-host-death family protein